MYDALSGRHRGRLIALFKIRSGYMQQDTVYRLAEVQFISVRTTVGRTRSGNRSAQRLYPRAHNCGYRDDLRPAASDTGDRAALACHHSHRYPHV